ncbi:type VII secretion protein EccB [Kribbella sp. NPDC051587]|uniref:type VII secretion protein EccB n=1 Tax=Kribbella sp. NPDC051587 TaxID=3364119 RepID=UPI0037B3E9D6
MQTKKDRVHAYQTLVGRMGAALLLGDTNYGEVPARRALFGLIFGVVFALFIGVAVWVYGLINPGGNVAWKQPGVVIVEKESGARFVYRDGVLVPVRNQASAMLLQGAGAKVKSVSRSSLKDVERARGIGIENAPDPLPAANALVTTPWLLCLPATGGVVVPGSGLMSMNANPDASSTRLSESEYFWVASPRGEQYVVLQGVKLHLDGPAVAVALGLGTAKPPTAPDAWLAALPDGPSVAPAVIPGNGTASVGGTSYPIGTVFQQGSNFVVLRRDGLAAVSRTEASLLQVAHGRGAVAIDAAALAAAPRSADDSLTKRLPDLLSMRSTPTGQRAFCLRQEPQGAAVISQAVTTERRFAWFGMSAEIGPYLKQGTGLLAASVPAPTAKGAKPDRYLITDQGLKFRLYDDAAISALGYGGVVPQPVAASVLAAMPEGPVLSRAAVGVFEKGQG